MCYFCGMYITFAPKNYRGVTYYNTEELCKIWRGTELCFENDMRNIWKILTQHSNVSKFALKWAPFDQSI